MIRWEFSFQWLSKSKTFVCLRFSSFIRFRSVIFTSMIFFMQKFLTFFTIFYITKIWKRHSKSFRTNFHFRFVFFSFEQIFVTNIGKSSSLFWNTSINRFNAQRFSSNIHSVKRFFLFKRNFRQFFFSFLSRTNSKIVFYAIWCLISLSNNDENRKKIRLTGAIPLLLSLVQNRDETPVKQKNFTLNVLFSSFSDGSMVWRS